MKGGNGGTYSVAGGLKLCPKPGIPDYGERYDVFYPLKDFGMDRKACIDLIKSVGLPVPPKSCCFF